MTAERTPQHVQCLECQHRWVAAYLPMEVGAFARLVKGMCCPMCAATSDKVAMREANDIPAVTSGVNLSEALRRWLGSGERGISSNCIVEHLTGVPALGSRSAFGHHPHDGDDLRRCMLLLEAVPELRSEMPRMASASKEWAALVPHWEELIDLLKRELKREPGTCGRTYQRMRQLLSPVDGGALYETDGDWEAFEQRRRRSRRPRRRL